MSYGSTNFQRGTVVYVKRYYRHENFNLQTFENDVAVLLLEHPLKMGVRTRTVCLPTQPRDIAGTTVAVAGWGVTKQDGAGTTSLMYTTQVVLEPKDCQKGLRGVSFFHPLQLCAYKQGSDACQVRGRMDYVTLRFSSPQGTLTCYQAVFNVTLEL